MAAAGRKTWASWRWTTKTFQAWCPWRHQRLQMLQVAAPPARYPVRKEGHPVFHPGDALDFQEEELAFHLQDKIQSAALGDGNFGPDPGGQRQAREAARGQGLGHQAVGDQGVDADPACGSPDKAPGIVGLAPRAGIAGQQNFLAGVEHSRSGPRNWAHAPRRAGGRATPPGPGNVAGAPGTGRESGAQKNARVQANRRAEIYCLVLN